MFLERPGWQIAWPPYVPPFITKFHGLFGPNEIIGSDMPCAVAWYGDRRSLWLPYTPEELTEISDYQKLGGPVAALYFTPVSGSENKLRDLIDGEYEHWWKYIVRSIDLKTSPYPVKAIPSASLAECVIYLDKPRRVESK